MALVLEEEGSSLSLSLESLRTWVLGRVSQLVKVWKEELSSGWPVFQSTGTDFLGAEYVCQRQKAGQPTSYVSLP